MMKILDLSELETELSQERETLSRPLFFFPEGTPVQEVKDWIQRTRKHETESYDTYKIEGLKI